MVRNTDSMIYDYVVFVILIFASLAVPFYTKFMGPKENTKADYVFAAASKVSLGAMLLSFARGTLGVRSFLGYPSELYYYGTAMYETLYGILLAYPIVSYVFVPVYYNLGITSVYQMPDVKREEKQMTAEEMIENVVMMFDPLLKMKPKGRLSGVLTYLDLRFKSQTVRCLASGTYILRNILNTGVTVFTPCVALKTIIGFPYWVSIVGITFISIICAVVGGLKAVILADVIQGLIMIACSLAIIIQGSLDTGGVDQIFKANYENGRFIFFNFNTDPTVRVTTLSALLGQLFMSLSIFGCQQNFVQRYCSMQSLKTIRRTLWTNIPVIGVLFSLYWIAGMVIFADYVSCDPLKLGYISKIDEIVPFYVEDKFTHIPGLLGIFMASLFNGALSLSVSNLNSMATVAWEDFLSKVPYFKQFKDKEQLLIIKSLGVLIGLLTMAVAFGVALLSGVIESSQLMTSATSGPLLGVFVLAMLFPGCNWKGAAAGMIISHIVTIWITFGSKLVDKGPNPMLPLSIDGCNNESFTNHVFPEYDATSIQGGIQWVNTTDIKNFYTDDTAQVASAPKDRDFLSQIYMTTYMYYSLLGSAICIAFGLLISYLTGTEESDVYDEKLIHPVARKLSRFFPGKPREYLKDTAIYKKEEKKEETLSPDIKLKNVFEGNGMSPPEEGKTNSTYQNNIKIHSSSNAESLPNKTNKR